ncbi:hypothetical protein ETB97_008857 [Aspergillus alliaceus]|uniref:Uncharacterized protein n=1 Tax=Petromyces alliaceus TaxID=209559 RepID=A0A8H5ZWF4_PETAA|nr:hypothetical protein ETB97_008857 [Aspergillus burnettii]
MAAEVLRDLPNLEMGISVGIAGGLPSSTREIRLGNVVVAIPEGDCLGVVGYDLGKANEDDTFELKHWQNATHPPLLSVIKLICTQNDSRFLRHLQVQDELPDFRRPGSPGDQLTLHYGTIFSGNSAIKSEKRRGGMQEKYGASRRKWKRRGC